MNVESIRTYALGLGNVEEGCPFGPNVLVFKVQGKIFLLLPLDTEQIQFNVKCNPEYAIELREKYPSCILPGYHMSKKHWNTIIVNGELNTTQLHQFIDDSYTLVALKKK